MSNAFDAKCPAVAAEPFTFAGRAFAAGEPFPHRDLGVDPLELDGLWRTGRIRFVDSMPSTAPPRPPARPPIAAPAKRYERHRHHRR
jgi:hypothetical protein